MKRRHDSPCKIHLNSCFALSFSISIGEIACTFFGVIENFPQTPHICGMHKASINSELLRHGNRYPQSQLSRHVRVQQCWKRWPNKCNLFVHTLLDGVEDDRCLMEIKLRSTSSNIMQHGGRGFNSSRVAGRSTRL